jgi:hypothetical protein
MKRLFLLGLLSLGIFASCQKEVAVVDSNKLDQTTEIIATLGDVVETRTQAQAVTNDEGKVLEYKTVWSENDAFRFFQVGMADLKCVLTSGAGNTQAYFGFAGGTIGGVGIEGDVNPDNDNFVGVYPFTDNARVAYVDGNYEVYTEIPTTQYYSENSFGYDAAPMVAVGEKINKLSFKNMGAILVVQMKGEASIASATLTSKANNIAGKVTATAHADNNWIPTLDLTEGTNKVNIVCEKGVALNNETATKFFFILAPGTYAANDLVLKFSDVAGFYNEFEIPVALTLGRSTSTTLSPKVFEINGSDAIPLRVRVKSTATLTADRIVPSIQSLEGSIDWIKTIAAEENVPALLAEVAAYIKMKEWELAYDALNGVPGFARETVTFVDTKTATAIVDYTGTLTFESIMNEIDKINDIESLIAYLRKAEEKYDALYDFTGTFNTAIGNIETMVENGFDTIIDNSPEEIEAIVKDGLKSYIGERLYNALKLDTYSLAGLLDNSFSKYFVDQVLSDLKAKIVTYFENMETVSLTEILESMTKESDSLTSKALTYLFEQEASLSYLKNLLKEIISGIEELEIDRVTGANTDLKKAAILAARNKAVEISVPAAKSAVNEAFESTNQEQLAKLSNGPWGLFQLLINSEDVAIFCAKNNLMEIYDALVELDNIVKDMVVYSQEGPIVLTPAKAAEYVENVDYWVETLTESEN